MAGIICGWGQHGALSLSIASFSRAGHTSSSKGNSNCLIHQASLNLPTILEPSASDKSQAVRVYVGTSTIQRFDAASSFAKYSPFYSWFTMTDQRSIVSNYFPCICSSSLNSVAATSTDLAGRYGLRSQSSRPESPPQYASYLQLQRPSCRLQDVNGALTPSYTPYPSAPAHLFSPDVLLSVLPPVKLSGKQVAFQTSLLYSLSISLLSQLSYY